VGGVGRSDQSADKLFYLATNDYSASAGSSSFAPGLPRTWAITVKRHWD
jgi:hypothetical protein